MDGLVKLECDPSYVNACLKLALADSTWHWQLNPCEGFAEPEAGQHLTATSNLSGSIWAADALHVLSFAGSE